MKKNSLVLSMLAAGGLLFCAACNNDYTGKENSHPLFAKGMSLKSSQNYSKAKDAFEGFLALCPKSARTHQELAELYNDYLGDYIRAVYHYERYIEYGKLSDIDRKDVRKLIDGCKKKFYERYQQENGLAPLPSDAAAGSVSSQDVQELENGLVAARQMQTVLTEKCRTLLAEKKRLEAELKAVISSRSADKKRNVPSGAQNLSPVRVPAVVPQTTADTAGVRTYKVQAGETLSMIARKFFGKSSAWKTIRDANPGEIGPDGVVRAGQVIRIPAAE